MSRRNSKSRRKPRQRKQSPKPIIRMVGAVEVADRPVPMIEVGNADGLDQMAVDRAIQATGLSTWLRPLRPDDWPDVERAVDPSPEALEQAEGFARLLEASTHMFVVSLAEGVRFRHPVTLYSPADLN